MNYPKVTSIVQACLLSYMSDFWEKNLPNLFLLVLNLLKRLNIETMIMKCVKQYEPLKNNMTL
jgi:hypothetical protein